MGTIVLYFVLGLACLFAIREFFKKTDAKNRQALKELQHRVKILEESENKLQAVIQHMNEAVAAIDSNFRITFYNDSFREIFSPDYAIDNHTAFTDVVRNIHLNELVSDVFQSGKTQKKTIELSVKNNQRTVEVQAVHIPMKNESLVGVVFYDLTEIKNAERMKRDFIANASHQLKTPLTAIQGYSEMLLDDQDMDKNMQGEFLKKIKLKSTEVADLVGKLLRLSKLEANVGSIQKEPVTIREMFENLERKFEGNAKKQQIQIIRHVPWSEISVKTDAGLLQLVMENLMENAIKYSNVGGKVYLAADKAGNGIEIKIRDEGIGIPAQDQARIFERFYRSSNAESHTQDGIGIGMALVKSALKKMDIQLMINSDQGKGTEMVLTFPAENPKAREA